jgi:cell division protein FtsX
VKADLRQERIVALVDERGFLSVGELSRLCEVSEMTIRRDLEQLHAQKRIQRTYGGAVSLRVETLPGEESGRLSPEEGSEALLLDQIDVLIATSVNPYYDSLIIDRATKKEIPIIAESIEMPNQRASVRADNYQAGFD